MAGLLYKDFVSVKGKKICLGCLTYLFLFTVLRIVFAGTREIDEFILTTKNGQTVNILDTFFQYALGVFLIMCVCYINLFVQRIVEDDQKNKVMNYMKSMPFEKNTYVASKYVFILICAYVSFAMYAFCGTICTAFMREGVMQDYQSVYDMIALPLIMLALFSAAVELPLFLRLGYEKAMLVKIAVWLVLALMAIGYMMFGDITIFDRIDPQVILEFMKAHQDAFMILQVVADVLPLALYYVSYCISSRMMAKEVE